MGGPRKLRRDHNRLLYLLLAEQLLPAPDPAIPLSQPQRCSSAFVPYVAKGPQLSGFKNKN